MTHPPNSIRDELLKVIDGLQREHDGSLQSKSVLSRTKVALQFPQYENRELEQSLLTEWGELFRTGVLAWGLNLSNPDPPFFHLTRRGRMALSNLTRDPTNPAGYLRHLDSIASLNAITESYLHEGLECYRDGRFKAAAVMVGVAAESVVLELRDRVVDRLETLKRPVPKSLTEWKLKTVTDALTKIFDTIDRKQAQATRESYDACWAPLVNQIRSARNDAGHPVSIQPVTPDAVHAALLVFPELVRTAAALDAWVLTQMV
ncbi:MAG: hypothetical protein U0Q55_15255 [Vicinamibacterales bacterium]